MNSNSPERHVLSLHYIRSPLAVQAGTPPPPPPVPASRFGVQLLDGWCCECKCPSSVPIPPPNMGGMNSSETQIGTSARNWCEHSFARCDYWSRVNGSSCATVPYCVILMKRHSKNKSFGRVFVRIQGQFPMKVSNLAFRLIVALLQQERFSSPVVSCVNNSTELISISDLDAAIANQCNHLRDCTVETSKNLVHLVGPFWLFIHNLWKKKKQQTICKPHRPHPILA